MKIIELRIRRLDKVEVFSGTDELEIIPGDYVIIESPKSSSDYGIVLSLLAKLPAGVKPEHLSRVIRKVTPEDVAQIEENYRHDEEAFRVCSEKIAEKNIKNMKLLDAEYSFSRAVVTFYYYAEERIDFRDLVRELAKAFNCRIEMRQVGRRDEARMLGGYGICGRQLCCSLFLREFKPITIRMVKEQNLPLDPGKVSGLCGRLMCCLAYENPDKKHCSNKKSCCALEIIPAIEAKEEEPAETDG